MDTLGPDSRAADRMRARRLRDLLHDCAGSAPREEADRVRGALGLVTGGGVPQSRMPDAGRIEALLASGAALDAVIELMGADTPFMLSRGAGGNCLATVISPQADDEAVGEGGTPALALLCAYIASELAGMELVRTALDGLTAPSHLRLH